MRPALEQILQQLIPPLVVALSGLLCVLIGFATNYIASKTNNAKVQAALGRLDQVMSDAVKSAQQTIIGSIKPGDNLATTLSEAKAVALSDVKSHYGEKGIAELKKVLGWDDVEKNLSTKLEAAVHDLKIERSASGVDDTAKNVVVPALVVPVAAPTT